MIAALESLAIDMFVGERRNLESWVLLSSALPNRRPNAAHLLGDVDDVAAAVDEVEGWYAERGKHPLFKVTPLTPTAVTDELARRGYKGSHGADVYELANLEGFDTSARVSLASDNEWFEIVGIGDPSAFVAAHKGDDLAWARIPGIAAGLGVRQGDTVGIFNMATVPEHRRHGHGSEVLRSILAWGRTQGATRAFLQVVRSNTAAVSLYRKNGFAFVYEYQYWTKTPE